MIRKFITSILDLAFSFVFLLLLVLLALNQTLFNADFYTGDFVDVVYPYVTEELPMEFDLSGFSGEISAEDLRVVFSQVFTKDLIVSAVDAAVEDFMAATVDENGEVLLSLPLSWISDREDLITEKLADNFVTRMELCETEEDLGENYSCIPQDKAVIDLKNDIEFDLGRVLFSEFPDAQIFPVKVPRMINGNVSEFLPSLMTKALVVLFALLLSILLLIFLIVHDDKNFFKQLSETLFSAGFLTALYLFAIVNFKPDFQSATVLNLFDLVSGLLFSHFYFYLIVTFVLAVTFWLISLKKWFHHDV